MSHHGRSTDAHSVWASLHERCGALGLFTWRCETSGAIVDEPRDPALLALWLRSAPVEKVVRDTASAWSHATTPEVREIAPGFWLIPVLLEQRRRRLGVMVAAALGPELLRTSFFAEACDAAGIDAAAARVAARKVAVFDGPGVSRTASSLQWMSRDLAGLIEHEAAVSGFTIELSQSYETIDMLYSLGRSMKNLDQPLAFMDELFDRLYNTMPFGWLATHLRDDGKLLGPAAGYKAVRGEPPWPHDEACRAAAQFQTLLESDPRTVVASGSTGMADDARVLVQPVLVSGKMVGVLFAGDRRGDDPQVSSYDMQLIEAAASFTGAFLENARLYRDQQEMFFGSLKALTAAIDAKDRYTCGHSERVAYLGKMLALAIGHTESQAQRVHLSGLLHDVGKIGVPEAVLCKPGRLTDDEFNAIKRHPQIGHDILSGIPTLEDILPGVLHHHERFDGKGYPARLAGRDIPLVARILGIADTFDAMSSTRSYRAALTREKVLAEFRACAGTQFDPDLAAAFVKLDFAEYDSMVQRHASVYTPAVVSPSPVTPATPVTPPRAEAA